MPQNNAFHATRNPGVIGLGFNYVGFPPAVSFFTKRILYAKRKPPLGHWNSSFNVGMATLRPREYGTAARLCIMELMNYELG